MRWIYNIALTLIVFFSLFLLYGQHKVYRYPALTLDPQVLATSNISSAKWMIHANGAYQKQVGETDLRAYEPNVSLQIISKTAGLGLDITVENIHPDAVLQTSADTAQIAEHLSGLSRTITLTGLGEGESINVNWLFPKKEQYRFAAVGDTGGSKELEWVLIRAKQLEADFVLHLGDAYYDASEVGNVGDRLNESEIPVYTANGNHDFRGPAGNAIDTFLRNIGPLNARFSLLGHCFINLDTGAYMYPTHKGARAAMLAAEIANQPQCTDYIVFTHKPIIAEFDAEFPQREHSLNLYDAQPLIKQLQALNNVTILAGHIHRDFEFEQDGIKTYVSGNGLAQTDLVEGAHHAQILLGEIRPGELLRTHWAENAMPMVYHCSRKILDSLEKTNIELAKEIKQNCSK